MAVLSVLNLARELSVEEALSEPQICVLLDGLLKLRLAELSSRVYI